MENETKLACEYHHKPEEIAQLEHLLIRETGIFPMFTTDNGGLSNQVYLGIESLKQLRDICERNIKRLREKE